MFLCKIAYISCIVYPTNAFIYELHVNCTSMYSHMIAFSRTSCTSEKWFNEAATPDVFARGEMTWKSAMGDTACVAACLLVRAASTAAAAAQCGAEKDTARGQSSGDAIGDEPTSASARCAATAAAAAAIVIDPFCGQGTVLAVANELGMDALGVELSRKRSRQALKLRALHAEDSPALSRQFSPVDSEMKSH